MAISAGTDSTPSGLGASTEAEDFGAPEFPEVSEVGVSGLPDLLDWPGAGDPGFGMAPSPR
ncbi:hypothetical protein HMPREF0297_1931, partial [Corynebacterium jeikeium ATCC 43734]